MSSNTSLETSPSPTPSGISNNAPKYGTLVPNRVFVGGISATTTEAELHQLFSAFGNVKATKIISDRAGVSKGYGFVTFETEEEARRSQQEADNIILKERKLNIAPAIKKQPFSRSYESSSPSPGPASPTGTVYYHNGTPYTYQNGMAIFPTPETYAFPQPQAAYPMMYPQPIYVPQQQYQYQTAMQAQPQWTNGQWRWLQPMSYSQPSSPMTAQYMYPPGGPLPIQGAPPLHAQPQDTNSTTAPVAVPPYSPSSYPPQGLHSSSQETFSGYGPPSMSGSSHVHQYQDQSGYSLPGASISSHAQQHSQDQGASDIAMGDPSSSHNTQDSSCMNSIHGQDHSLHITLVEVPQASTVLMEGERKDSVSCSTEETTHTGDQGSGSQNLSLGPAMTQAVVQTPVVEQPKAPIRVTPVVSLKNLQVEEQSPSPYIQCPSAAAKNGSLHAKLLNQGSGAGCKMTPSHSQPPPTQTHKSATTQSGTCAVMPPIPAHSHMYLNTPCLSPYQMFYLYYPQPHMYVPHYKKPGYHSPSPASASQPNPQPATLTRTFAVSGQTTAQLPESQEKYGSRLITGSPRKKQPQCYNRNYHSPSPTKRYPRYVSPMSSALSYSADFLSSPEQVSRPQPRHRHYSSPRKIGTSHQCQGRNGHPLATRKLVPKTVNGVHVLAVEKSEDVIGAAGDASLPPLPMTPPATPVNRTGSTTIEVNHMQHRMSDTVQQMQALTL